jgi:hypothetical protein
MKTGMKRCGTPCSGLETIAASSELRQTRSALAFRRNDLVRFMLGAVETIAAKHWLTIVAPADSETGSQASRPPCWSLQQSRAARPRSRAPAPIVSREDSR